MDIAKFEKDVLKKAQVTLRCKPELEFLGIISYGLEFHLASAEYMMKATGGRSHIGFTDGSSIYLGVVPEMTPLQLAFVIAHEVLHVVSMHITRLGSRDPLIWNLATDHVVNRMLKEYSRIGMLQELDNLVFFEDIHQKYPNISAEELYAKLIENRPQMKVEIFQIGKNGKAQKIGESGDSDGGGSSDDKDEENSDSNNTKSKKGGKDNKSDGENQQDEGDSGDDTPEEFKGLVGKKFAKVTNLKTNETWIVPLDSQAESKETEDRCEEMLNESRVIWNSNTVNKGNIPGNILKEFDKIFKVEIPWDEVLHRSLMYHSQKLDHRSWVERDNYIRCVRLPGKATGQDTQVAIFVIDSSGSVCDEDLMKFIGIVCDATHHYDKIITIVHDHKIHMEEWFMDKPNEQDVFERIKKIKGRGGTSHLEVFDRIEQINKEELISIVTFSTDFYSDIEHIHRNYEWVKDLPMIFVLNNNNEVHLDENYDIKVINIPGGM